MGENGKGKSGELLEETESETKLRCATTTRQPRGLAAAAADGKDGSSSSSIRSRRLRLSRRCQAMTLERREQQPASPTRPLALCTANFTQQCQHRLILPTPTR